MRKKKFKKIKVIKIREILIWDGTDESCDKITECLGYTYSNFIDGTLARNHSHFYIITKNGAMTLSKGDGVVKYNNGNIGFLCKK